VRIGNLAHTQCQLDVYGEVISALHLAREMETESDSDTWMLQRVLLEFLETIWRDPDEGMWEVRAERQHFVHSKVMAWVAFDRGIDAVERFGFKGPVEHWRHVRQEIHDDICRHGFDKHRNSFVQCYGSTALDASLLMMVLVGFLPPDDPRIVGTVEAIQRELMVDGLVLRYRTEKTKDGLPPGEGTFLACSFWLVNALVVLGRTAEAEEIFERLLRIQNDLGLMAEEYDPVNKRQLGNFPQAFSHVSLINSARRLNRGASRVDLTKPT
jgi:GH15 family glucan-1,4-alpha-glucosidase